MAQPIISNDTNTSDPHTTNDVELPDWQIAKNGIYLLINNKEKEAEQLFHEHWDKLSVFAGYSFAVFMDALMTFEHDKFSLAMKTLRELEHRCLNHTDTLMKSLKRRMFGGSGTSSESDSCNFAHSLEVQIILADSEMCLAILTFLQHDITGYLKGGWLLRKAWKIYQKIYNEIYALYEEVFGETLHLPGPIKTRSNTEDNRSTNLRNSKSQVFTTSPSGASLTTTSKRYSATSTTSLSTHSHPFNIKRSVSESNSVSHLSRRQHFNPMLFRLTHLFSSSDNELKFTKVHIDPSTVQRLMCAVCFGYGVIQLGISLLPHGLIRLSSLLGLGGDHVDAISCLNYGRQGSDMRAPLATLSLLWHYTIIRPFFSIESDDNLQSGVDTAAQILSDFDTEFGESALFLFFNGRVNILNSNTDSALEYFKLATEKSSHREIKILSMHEMGWCFLIKLDLQRAEEIFLHLKIKSRWSKGFYSYMSNICAGANEKDPDLIETRNNIRKGSQLEAFLINRCSRNPNSCPDSIPTTLITTYWRLLVYEMLYLWNNLSICIADNIKSIKNDCEIIVQKQRFIDPMMGLARLILGYCFLLQRQVPNAIANFKECLQLREIYSDSCDVHVSAFAQYELGSILLQSMDTRLEGKRLLLEIPYFSAFDFQERLNFRIHNKLRHLTT